MTDSASAKSYTLACLAERFQLTLTGDGTHEVSSVGTLAGSGPGDLTFLANRSYRSQLETTRAGVVILAEADAAACPVNCLVADDPYLAYARVATIFDVRPKEPPGIHPTAAIDPAAVLGEDVHVGAQAVIGPRTRVGPGSSIGPGCVVGPDCVLGTGCRLAANVTVLDGVRMGDRVILHSGAVIGADGFGLAHAGDHWEKVPQLGGVIIGDDCEIGANTAVDRGAIEDTILEEDVRLDNLVQVGHNARIGAHTAIAGCTAVAGSARIGRHCLIGGSAGVNGHVEIADRTTIAAKSAVMKSITEPGTVWGAPIAARPLRDWQRSLARLNRLDKLVERIRKLEEQLEERREQ